MRKIRAIIARSYGVAPPKSILSLHRKQRSRAEFNDSIAFLAPQWGSAVDFGGAKIRARIVLSYGAVPPKSILVLHRKQHSHAEFHDSITLLAPQWGSAVHFGGPKIRARIALSHGAVCPNTGLNSACNVHADDHTPGSPMGGCRRHRKRE